MATWTGGKTDWAAPDAIPHTELNKIGDNLDYLYALYGSGGPITANVGNIPAAGTRLLAMYTIAVPDAHRIVLRRASAYLSHASDDMRLRVDSGAVGGGVHGATWNSASNKFDTSPAHVVYTNNTGGAEAVIVPRVWAVNSGAGNATVDYFDTFAVVFGVEPV